MPHAETQQHGQNACGLGTAELKENGGFDNGFQSAKMGIYIFKIYSDILNPSI